MLAATAAVAAASLLAPASAGAGLTPAESGLLSAVNDVRASYGLQPLRLDPRLERAARGHSRQMLLSDVLAHGALLERITRYGVDWRLVGENLAWGSGSDASADAIVAAWLASPPHRANLLDAGFTRVGVGALVGLFHGSPDARVVTADFAG